MSYDEFERSNYDGRPVNYFEFVVDSTTWRYTDAMTEQTLSDNIYTPAIIAAEGIVISGEADADELTITIPADIPFAALYRGTPPSSQVLVRIRRRHIGDVYGRLVWVGVVKSSRRRNLVSMDLICRVLTADLARPGARLAWMRGCPYALYDRNCAVSPNAYVLSTQVTSLTQMRLYVSVGVAPADYFSGGYIRFVHPAGYMERRAIAWQPGANLLLMTPTDGISVGDWISVYPGCDRTSATCNAKFNNIDNYGGFRHMPTKSPFDGDPVF